MGMVPALAGADSITQTLSGSTAGGQPVSLRVTIDFLPGPGDFSHGTGTAAVTFTLENTSDVFPFQSPALGNPVITGFFFNVPPGTQVSYSDAQILAPGSLYSANGAIIAGDLITAGYQAVSANKNVTSWYVVDDHQATGQFGVFTNTVETGSGVRASIANAHLFAGGSPQGSLFAPLVIAGRVSLTIQLSQLTPSLDSAADFLALCSSAPGSQQPSALGGKLQSGDINGAGSAFVGTPCSPTRTHESTWGKIKLLYR